MNGPGRLTGLPPGCPAFIVLFALLLLIPFFFARLMLAAVAQLGLPSDLALLALFGIFLGGAVNIPVKRVERHEELPVQPLALYGFGRILPRLGFEPAGGGPYRTYTTIAVNLGGCVIPVALAVYEVVRIVGRGPATIGIAAGIAALDVLACYRLARPMPNVGIAMPALVPPVIAAVPSLLLVPDFAPPVAFVAGVLGPLVGADVLHLREIRTVPTGVASIGGAGTFDGIVLSGMIAALLA